MHKYPLQQSHDIYIILVSSREGNLVAGDKEEKAIVHCRCALTAAGRGVQCGKEVSLDPKWQCLLIYTLSQENGFNLVTELQKELHGQRPSPRKESEEVGHKFQLSPSAGPYQTHFSVLDQERLTCAENNSEQLRESCLGFGIPC